MSSPVLDLPTNVTLDSPLDISTSRDQLSLAALENINKTVPIPLQQRAYACLIEDNSTNIYLTNDNYMAYCAVEDRCMVHIALEVSSCDGVEDQVRHCFNINQDGSTVEYWLHADLIPFHNPSDAESGVFSDDDECSAGTDSGQEDNSEDNNVDENKSIIEGEWEIIDKHVENVDEWLNEPRILKKYVEEKYIDGVKQTESDMHEKYTSSSSDDSDDSSFSDLDSEMESTCSSALQNTALNPTQDSLKTSDKKNSQDDVVAISDSVVMEQIESPARNTDSPVKSDDIVVLADQETKIINADKKSIDSSLETSQGLASSSKEENVDVFRFKKNGNELG